ncbi:hypothetical protein GGR50DRAFT_665440 [Xylaria sp. CBS 124048]|nr:hypothetical protein GGR50DRAFT_665440 [Xylaria sp. CBS 124048]
MASPVAQLRGSCRCGRNQYSVQVPKDSSNSAQVIFDSDSNHRMSSASPLSAFIRIPLLWYRSEVFPFFPDESRSTIRRSYTHPTESHTQRRFCGYCGTPLSYWSEESPDEAEYIFLTLGSLLTEDLHNLQELGLVPGEDTPPDERRMGVIPTVGHEPSRALMGRDTTDIPWFDSLVSGSRLGTMRTTRGVQRSRDGTKRIEFEVTEWTADDGIDEGEEAAYASESSASATAKRRRVNTTDKENARMFAPFGTI